MSLMILSLTSPGGESPLGPPEECSFSDLSSEDMLLRIPSFSAFRSRGMVVSQGTGVAFPNEAVALGCLKDVRDKEMKRTGNRKRRRRRCKRPIDSDSDVLVRIRSSCQHLALGAQLAGQWGILMCG